MSQNGGNQDDANTEVIEPQDGGQTGDDAGGTAEAPPAKPTPEDPIRQAERELQKAQDRLTDAKDKAKRDDEIDKALGEYEAVQVDLEADEAALIEHLGEAMARLAPTTKEKDKVKAEIDRLKKPMDTLKASITKQRTDLTNKKATLTARTADRDAAKAAFEARKNQVKEVEDRHRAGSAIRKEVADARSKGQRLLAYFLLEHKLGPATRGEPQPIEDDEYKQAIGDESVAYGTLNRTVADLEAEIKANEKKLADDEKALAELEKAFEPSLRARLTA